MARGGDAAGEAGAAAGDAGVILGAVMRLPVADIDMGARLRPVDAGWAEALGGIIAKDGQMTPIEVCRIPGRPGWLLVTGAHRLSGARLHGMETILAVEVGADAAERRLREVSENLWRRNLSPMDRAAFVGEMIELAKARAGLSGTDDGRVASTRARWGDGNRRAAAIKGSEASDALEIAYGWSDAVADRIGMSRRSVYRDMLLYKGLAPTLRDRLRALPGHDNAATLQKLAALDWHRQARIVLAVEAGAAPDLKAALTMAAGRPRPGAAEKAGSSIIGGFGRLGRDERVRLLTALRDLYPAEWAAATGAMTKEAGRNG